MAYGRFITPGYRRTVRERLHDQKVKLVGAISGRWLPSSKEVRAARMGAMVAGEATAARERAKEPHRALAFRRRMKQANLEKGGAEEGQVPSQQPTGEGETDTGENVLARLLRRRLTTSPEEEED